jgi:hypothetical protein
VGSICGLAVGRTLLRHPASGRNTPIQRCQVHKARSITERLPKPLHASVKRLDFYLDPRAIDGGAIERIRETLRNAIAALEGRDEEEAPVGSHDRTKGLPPLAGDKST